MMAIDHDGALIGQTHYSTDHTLDQKNPLLNGPVLTAVYTIV